MSKKRPSTVARALECCSGQVEENTLKDANSIYDTFNRNYLSMDTSLRDQLKSKTKGTIFALLSDEDKKLGGALYIALQELEKSRKVDLTDVWPRYSLLIEVYKRQKKVKREEQGGVTETPPSAIQQILTAYESKRERKLKLKEASQQFKSLLTHHLHAYPEFSDLQEKVKNTKIEPHHISTKHHKLVPELYEVVENAWAKQFDFSEEAVKELYVTLETYSRVKVKPTQNPDSTKSHELHSKTSSGHPTPLSTDKIEIVLKLCEKIYKADPTRKAKEELELLKEYNKKLFSSKEMEQQRRDWYERCSRATPEILGSIQQTKRPLYNLLIHADDDKTPNSKEALSEYCALLQLEMLFPDDAKMLGEKSKNTVAPSVHESTERMSIEDIIKSMEKVVSPSVCKEARQEYEKLQEIENLISQDKDLRSRKNEWKTYAPEGAKRYTEVNLPKRSLHIVLDRAQKEGICGSKLALREYGSMLHSQVLYDSKDNVTQMMAMSEDSDMSDDLQNKQKSVIHVKRDADPAMVSHEKNRKEENGERRTDGASVVTKSYLDTKQTMGRSISQTDGDQYLRSRHRDEGREFLLQQEVDRLQEQLQIKNSEIEDLTTRLSQAASRSLMFNNPNIADLSDKNRPTKLGERFEQLYDNEWTDAFETLKTSLSSERKVFTILLEIIKDVNKFCKNALDQQILELKCALVERIKDPKFKDGSKVYVGVGRPDDMLSWRCDKSAAEIQKGNALNSVLGLAKIYKDFCEDRKFLQKSLQSTMFKKVYPYVDALVELCWLMCTQTPPMQLHFAVENEAIDKSLFRCMGHSGSKVDVCVWPAVILHDGGPVVMKGHVLPL